MATLVYDTIPKSELAFSQLNVAIGLFAGSKEYPAVITLAGAAEEIYGKLVQQKGGKTALKEISERLCEMHRAAFNEEPNEKDYVNLRNRTKNELKHIGTGGDLTADLEYEASELLERALHNYREYTGSHHPHLPEFMSKTRSMWASRSMLG